jgi:aconitase A
MHGTMTGKIFEAYLVERRLAPARRSPSPCSTSNYSQGSNREHAASLPATWRLRRPRPGFARIHRGNLIAQGLVPLYIDADVHDRLEVGDRLAIPGLRGRGHEQRGRGRDPDREERAVPSPARPLPRERRVLIADSVLNQLSTERTHHDGSVLTPKPRTPAAQSPDVGNLVLGWDLTFADVQPVRSRTT